MSTEDLLNEIEATLTKTGLSATKFGKDAVGDPSFVFDLREGKRDLRMSTVQKVRDFIAGQGAS
jgi:predicted transcriptional regulator